MVHQLPGNPAAIYDPSWSPITWNSMWATIFGDPNERPVRERNKVWRYFTGLPTRVLRSSQDERRFCRHEGLRVVVFTAPAGSSSAKALIAAQSLALDQHPLSASEASRPAHRLLRPAV